MQLLQYINLTLKSVRTVFFLICYLSKIFFSVGSAILLPVIIGYCANLCYAITAVYQSYLEIRA
jgi:hypothetical protein